MFVRAKRRFKDGKEHRYWSVVENCRNPDGRVVQRQVLYLGEINDGQRAAWCRSIEILCGDSGSKPVALFPADPEAPELTPRAILEKCSAMQMVDVHLPTTDGRHLVLPRRTDPTLDQLLLLHQLGLELPEQPPPRISA